MPPKRWQWITEMATAPKSGKPLLKTSWEKKTHNTRFKPAATSSSAQSWQSSKRTHSVRDSLADLETVREVPQWVTDELHRRSNPLYIPKRNRFDTDYQWGQLRLRFLEFSQRIRGTAESREQARALAAANAFWASPVNLLPVPDNYFSR